MGGPPPVCGTRGGYNKHLRLGEETCEACRAANREFVTAQSRARGVAPRKEAQCGTVSGYRRHLRLGEETCEACRAPVMERQRDRRGRARGWR